MSQPDPPNLHSRMRELEVIRPSGYRIVAPEKAEDLEFGPLVDAALIALLRRLPQSTPDKPVRLVSSDLTGINRDGTPAAPLPSLYAVNKALEGFVSGLGLLYSDARCQGVASALQSMVWRENPVDCLAIRVDPLLHDLVAHHDPHTIHEEMVKAGTPLLIPKDHPGV